MLRNAEALTEFQKAVDLDPKNNKAWEQIGFLLTDRMDYTNAEKAFQNAVALQPGSAAALQGLAQVYFLTQQADKSIDMNKKLLDVEPDNITALYNLGVLVSAKDPASAKQYFQKVILLNPNYAEAHNNLGVLDYNDGQYDLAISENEKALTLKPALASAHLTLSQAYEKKQNYSQAAMHLQQYIQLSGSTDAALKTKLEQLQRM